MGSEIFKKDLGIVLNTKLIKSYYHIMAKRITIVLDDDLLKKLREKQSKLIKVSVKSVSFSSVVNETLRKSIK